MSSGDIAKMRNFSGRVDSERLRLGFTQDEMAKIGGISKRTYCAYEAGESPPSAAFLAAIAAAGADVQYIITGQRSDEGRPVGRGIPGYPEIGAEDVVETLEVIIRAFKEDGRPLPADLPKYLRLVCEYHVDNQRKVGARKNSIIDISILRGILKFFG